MPGVLQYHSDQNITYLSKYVKTRNALYKRFHVKHNLNRQAEVGFPQAPD